MNEPGSWYKFESNFVLTYFSDSITVLGFLIFLMLNCFYLYDVVIVVYATDTWLAGCPSHAGIVPNG